MPTTEDRLYCLTFTETEISGLCSVIVDKGKQKCGRNAALCVSVSCVAHSSFKMLCTICLVFQGTNWKRSNPLMACVFKFILNLFQAFLFVNCRRNLCFCCRSGHHRSAGEQRAARGRRKFHSRCQHCGDFPFSMLSP